MSYIVTITSACRDPVCWHLRDKLSGKKYKVTSKGNLTVLIATYWISIVKMRKKYQGSLCELLCCPRFLACRGLALLVVKDFFVSLARLASQIYSSSIFFKTGHQVAEGIFSFSSTDVEIESDNDCCTLNNLRWHWILVRKSTIVSNEHEGEKREKMTLIYPDEVRTSTHIHALISRIHLRTLLIIWKKECEIQDKS